MTTPDRPLLEAFRGVLLTLESAPLRDGHGWRTMIVATVGADGAPASRVVVLRGFDAGAAMATFYTDVRTPKVVELEAEPRVALLWWDRQHSVQVRATGVATLYAPGSARAVAAFGDLSPRQVLDYGGALPGSVLDDGDADGPKARDSFAVVDVTCHRFDVLWLRREAHRRAVLQRPDSTGDWAGTWTNP